MEYEISKYKNEAAALENLVGEFDLEGVIGM